MEKTNLTTEEVEVLKNLRLKFRQKIFNFGQIQLERFGIKANIDELNTRLDGLNESEIALQSEYLDVQKEETLILSKIKEKYGEGTISLEDNTFTPIEKV